MNDLVILKDGIETMTSTQFAEMTGRSKSSIHRTIRDKFDVESVGCEIASSMGDNGMTTEYHLPETESIMLCAILDSCTFDTECFPGRCIKSMGSISGTCAGDYNLVEDDICVDVFVW